MKIYRISSTRYINDLSGMGGLYSDGRWHRKGTRIIYFSETVALAKLEKLANTPIGIPNGQKLLVLSIPETYQIDVLDVSKLDDHWSSRPPSLNNYDLVENWLAEDGFLLKVPSIHSPYEYNYLLNPDNYYVSSLSKEIRELDFDTRLK